MSQNQNINFRNRTQEDSRVTYTANSKSSWFTQGQKKHIKLEERKREGEKGEKNNISTFAFSILHTGDLGSAPKCHQKKQ